MRAQFNGLLEAQAQALSRRKHGMELGLMLPVALAARRTGGLATGLAQRLGLARWATAAVAFAAESATFTAGMSSLSGRPAGLEDYAHDAAMFFALAQVGRVAGRLAGVLKPSTRSQQLSQTLLREGITVSAVAGSMTAYEAFLGQGPEARALLGTFQRHLLVVSVLHGAQRLVRHVDGRMAVSRQKAELAEIGVEVRQAIQSFEQSLAAGDRAGVEAADLDMAVALGRAKETAGLLEAEAARLGLELPRQATGGRNGVREIDFLNAEIEAPKIEAIRQGLLTRKDVGQVQETLARFGVRVDREMLATIKRYNFDSAGTGFDYRNVQAWRPLASGRGLLTDVRYIVHERAEVEALRKVQQETGFDFMGKRYKKMPSSQATRWEATFNTVYLKAHRQALAAEYGFVAQRVSSRLSWYPCGAREVETQEKKSMTPTKEDLQFVLRSMENKDPAERVLTLNAVRRKPIGDPRVLPCIEKALEDRTVVVLGIPYYIGEIRWAAAPAVFAERQAMGITTPIHFIQQPRPMYPDDIRNLGREHSVPKTKSGNEGAIEVYEGLRERGLIPLVDISWPWHRRH